MTREATNAVQKNNNKNKATKHTIEFSNNTPPAARKTRGSWPLTRCADDERTPPKWNFPLGHRRARRATRVAATRLSYATGNLESNKLLGGVFRAWAGSTEAFDPGDVALAAAQHQPPSAQEVGGLRRPGLPVDFVVVDVRPAVGCRGARGPLAGRQAAGDKQVHDP